MRLSNQNAHVYINLNMGSKFLFHFIHILESKVFFYIHIILFLGIKYQAWNVHMNKPLQNIYGNKTDSCFLCYTFSDILFKSANWAL